ncbi:MAG: hypothetical protein BWX72_01663 [Firmicutes bacterium ADurb.Bin080]|nr:MAG: hypothetical protein BWX72_01663 [Firmicutes bacterium ADurb.Bin080]
MIGNMEIINKRTTGKTSRANIIYMFFCVVFFSLVIALASPSFIHANAVSFYDVSVTITVNGFPNENFDAYLDSEENQIDDFEYQLGYVDGEFLTEVLDGSYYLYIFSESNQIVEEILLEINQNIFETIEFYDFGEGLTEETPVETWGIGSANIGWYVNNPSSSEFHISSGADLAGLAAIVNNGAGVLNYDALGILSSTGNFIDLTTPESFIGDVIFIDNNIFLGDYEWIPIGTLTDIFEGTLKGGGNTINGVYINSPGSTFPQGLFSAIPGDIENVILDKGYINGGENVGALAGGSTGKIYDSRNNGVNIIGDSYIGGITGVLSGEGEILRTYNSSSIYGFGYLGGITGITGTNTVISDGENYGSIEGENNIIGGISGENQGYIKDSFNEGRVLGNSLLGGIAGINGATGIILNSYNEGDIQGNSYIGGIAGEHQSGGILDNSYNIGRIDGDITSGGIAGTVNSNVRNCFNAGQILLGDPIGNESADYISYCYYLSEEDTSEEQNTKRNAFSFEGGAYRVNAFEQYIIYSQVVTADDTTLLSSALHDWAEAEGGDYISWKEGDDLPEFLAKYSVNFPSVQGCTFSPYGGSSSPVMENEAFSFVVTLLPGYTNSIITVKANGVVLFRSSGVYTVSSITENINITVEDITPNEYVVKFVSDNDVLSERYDFHYGDIPAPPINPEKAPTETKTFSFIGWDKELLPISSDVTFYALYQESTRYYSVVFLNEGETISEKNDYEYGQELIVPSDPEKQAEEIYYYTFSGWDSELTNVYESKQYIAIFSAFFVEYTVRFLSEGTVIQEKTNAHYGDTILPPENPTKSSDNTFTYEFSGWDKALSTVESDIDFNARFNSIYKDYIITFISDGIILSSDVYHFGEEILPPEPTKESDLQYEYTFSGWNEEVIPVDGNKVYSAIFNRSERLYSIVFSEEEVILCSLNLPYGAEVNGPDLAKMPDQEYEYTFIGWDPQITQVTSDIVYSPVYEREFRMYSVEFRKDDIVVSRRLNYRFNEIIEYPPAVSKETDGENAYEFIGWDNDAIRVTESVIISAVFAPRPLNVYPDPNDQARVNISAFLEGGFNQGTRIIGRKVNSSIIDFSSEISQGEELYSIYNTSLQSGDTIIVGDLGNYLVTLGMDDLEEGRGVKIVVYEDGELVSYYTEVLNGNIVFPMSSTGDFALIVEGEFVEYASISPWVYVISFLSLALILLAEWIILKPVKKISKKKISQ